MNRAADFTSDRARVISKWLAHSVLPLYRATEGGRPEPFATCTLIEASGRSCLVTAGHALEDLGHSEIYFGNTALGQLRQVPARTAYSLVERDGGPLPLDIAIAPISREHKNEFEGCRFLGATDIALADRPDYANLGFSLYCMIGFSASKSQFRLQAERRHIIQSVFPLTGIPSALSKYEQGNLNPALHLALDYDEKDIRHRGRRVVPPRLQGVSGGGMFRFDGLNATGKLVAIAVEHRKDQRVVVGTRIDIVIGLIESVIRELGDKMFE